MKLVFRKKKTVQRGDHYAVITLDFIEWQAIRRIGLEQTVEKIVQLDGSSFFQDYTDFIAQLAPQVRGRFWEASDMACRYRFNTEMPSLLAIFDHVKDTMRKGQFDEIEVLSNNVSWAEPLTKDPTNPYRLIDRSYAHSLREPIARAKIGLRLLLSQARSAAVIWLRGIAARRHIPRPDEQNKGDYLVFKSFTYLNSFNGSYVDPFFAQLPGTLQKQGFQILILTKIFTDYAKILQSVVKQGSFQIFPVEFFLGFRDICKAYFIFLGSRFRLRGQAIWQGSDVSHLINAELRKTVFGLRLENIVHYFANRRLLRSVSVRQYVYTFENMPWEKFTLKALRETSPSPMTIAYQHSVIPQNAANNYISKFETPRDYPDIILTTGRITERLIKHHSSARSPKVSAFCALRYDYLYKIKSPKRKVKRQQPTILVALEGVRPAGPLVDYVVSELCNSPAYDVVFRFHPILPYEKMTSFVRHDPLKYGHMRISKNKTVVEDLQECDALIYGGSTVALEGIMYGVPVIHYHMTGYFNFDPLYALQTNKHTVTAKGDLSRCLARIYNGRTGDRAKLAKSARKYIEKYFFPVTAPRIQVLTEVLHMKRRDA